MSKKQKLSKVKSAVNKAKSLVESSTQNLPELFEWMQSGQSKNKTSANSVHPQLDDQIVNIFEFKIEVNKNRYKNQEVMDHKNFKCNHEKDEADCHENCDCYFCCLFETYDECDEKNQNVTSVRLRKRLEKIQGNMTS